MQDARASCETHSSCGEESILSGLLADQAALHAVLAKIRDLNLKLISVTRLSADTAGGNMDVVLPDRVADLSVTAKTGAGNVTVLVPGGIPARVHATSGLGKVIVDSRFSKIDRNTYQSPGYDRAASRAEITVSSGAGNVSVNTR